MIKIWVLGNGDNKRKELWSVNANKVDFITNAPNGGCVIHLGKHRLCSPLNLEEAHTKFELALERD